MKTSKYPRELAKAETSSRRQYDFNKIKLSEPSDAALLIKKGTFTFANAYPYIFDALSALCTEYATTKYEDAEGKIRNVIERQENNTETHYRAILKIDTFAQMALNGHNEYWSTFLQQLYHLASHPEKKNLPFKEGYTILTEPVRIDIVSGDGNKISESEKTRLSNLKNRQNPEKGYIAFIIIEFYKPLFYCLLNKNKKGELGYNYIQVPKGLQAEIKATADILREISFFDFTDIDAEKVPLYDMDVRATFLYLALHDNRQGEHITIDATDFAMSCFPGCVQNQTKKDENGNQVTVPYISKANGFLIRSKIKKSIVTLKLIGKIGRMNGGQFIPLELELDENNVWYNHEEKTYKIKVLRPKNQAYPVFDPTDL